MDPEIKSLIEQQGVAFAAFKTTLDEMKKTDTVLDTKIAKIEKALDDAVEAKAAIEAKIEAERKEREDLELRLTKLGKAAGADAALEAKRVEFELTVRALAADKKNGTLPVITHENLGDYRAAFKSYLRGGKDSVSADELKAMSVGGDPQGGYFVDPDTSGRIVTRVYETSIMRPICNVVNISTDMLEGIEDLNEAGSGWVGETQSRVETTTPDVGKYRIPVFEIYAEPRVTQKLIDDAAVDIASWLATKVADRISRRENLAFVAGNGVTQPRGLTDYATAADDGSGSVAWGTIGRVKTGANGGFIAPTSSASPADCLFDLIGTLKDAYLPNARFLTRRSIITLMRKFKDANGNLIWQPSLLAGAPETLLGYAITRAEDMPALATNSLSLYFGDFRQAYTILDRIGFRTLVDPYTAKPYIKYYTTKRVGGGVVNFEAVKALYFAA